MTVILSTHQDKEMYRAGLDALLETIEEVREDNPDKWPDLETGMAICVQLIAFHVYPGPARIELPEWLVEWQKIHGGGYER